MSFFQRVKRYFSSLLTRKEKAPVHADCAKCGERVYLPYYCHYCKQYFCGEHRLPFNHDCRNIDAWKKRGLSDGSATEYRKGRFRVRK